MPPEVRRPVTWRSRWEVDLTEAEHTAIAELAAAAFPRSDFGGRSWHSARPEGRLIGYDGDRPVAHLAFLRRSVRVGGVPIGGVPVGGAGTDAWQHVPVADVGIVCVDPAAQGRGLGRELLGRAGALLATLGVPFGLLTTGEAERRFYAVGGWRATPTQVTRMIGRDERVETFTEATLYLPLTEREDFPVGEIVRDGYEV